MNSNDLFDQLLLEAEERFGPRSRATLIPIVMPRDNPTPETVRNGADGCYVYYYSKVANDNERLRFQLAHEAIHVLSGAFKRDARNLEEGFAVWFSLYHHQMSRPSRRHQKAFLPPLFKNALTLFGQMKPTDRKIKQLRSECPDLDNVSQEHLIQIFSVSVEQAQKILERVPIEMHARLV